MRKEGLRLPACLSAFLLFSVAVTAQQPSESQLRELRTAIRAEFGVDLPPLPVPANNPQTKEKIELGEALFFDPNLSSCGNISCGSCHIPEQGFGDGQQVSDGCKGAVGRRNSNTVYNNAYQSHFFWDGRVQSLEEQALGPVVDPAEMGNTWDNVVEYLKTGVHPVTKAEFPAARKYYQSRFERVFEGEVNSTNVAKAIAAYERTVVSSDSPYDRWVKGDDSALNSAQKKGMLVFFGRGGCSDCHRPPNFTDSDFHNVGTPNAGCESKAQFPFNSQICGGIEPAVDPGRAEVGFLRSSCGDLGKFKTPTLRNLESSGPFMHNGVFKTLEEVCTHYQMIARGARAAVVGRVAPEVLHAKLGDAGGQPDDIANLVAFLKALNGTALKSPDRGVAPPSAK